MKNYTNNLNMIKKIIAAITIIAFVSSAIPVDALTESGSTLAPYSRIQAVNAEKLIYLALHVPHIMYAETEVNKNLLRRYGADALLVENGKYLVSKSIFENNEKIIDLFTRRKIGEILEAAKSDPLIERILLRLTRVMIHENIEKLMRIISATDGNRYRSIRSYIFSQKEMIDAYQNYISSTAATRRLSGDLFLNDMVASAFEIIILKKAGIISEAKMTSAEKALEKAAEPVFKANRHQYFTVEFWDEAELNKAVTRSLHIGYADEIVAHPSSSLTLEEKIENLTKDLKYEMPKTFDERFASYYILRLKLIADIDQNKPDDFRLHYSRMLVLLGALGSDLKTVKDEKIGELAGQIVLSGLVPDYILGTAYSLPTPEETAAAVRKELTGLTTLEFDKKTQRAKDDAIDEIVNELYEDEAKRESMKAELKRDVKPAQNS